MFCVCPSVHPHSGGPAGFLSERPGLRCQSAHHGPARQTGVFHRGHEESAAGPGPAVRRQEPQTHATPVRETNTPSSVKSAENVKLHTGVYFTFETFNLPKNTISVSHVFMFMFISLQSENQLDLKLETFTTNSEASLKSDHIENVSVKLLSHSCQRIYRSSSYIIVMYTTVTVKQSGKNLRFPR